MGLSGSFRPKFVKAYADLRKSMTDAIKTYIDEVKEGVFPDDEHSFH